MSGYYGGYQQHHHQSRPLSPDDATQAALSLLRLSPTTPNNISLPSITSFDSHLLPNGHILPPILPRKGYYKPETDSIIDTSSRKRKRKSPVASSSTNYVSQYTHPNDSQLTLPPRPVINVQNSYTFPPVQQHQRSQQPTLPPPPIITSSHNYQHIPPPIPSKPQTPIPSTSAEAIVCICHNNVDLGTFMIACDVCTNWLHGECVQIAEVTAPDKWICPFCTAGGVGHRKKKEEPKKKKARRGTITPSAVVDPTPFIPMPAPVVGQFVQEHYAQPVHHPTAPLSIPRQSHSRSPTSIPNHYNHASSSKTRPSSNPPNPFSQPQSRPRTPTPPIPPPEIEDPAPLTYLPIQEDIVSPEAREILDNFGQRILNGHLVQSKGKEVEGRNVATALWDGKEDWEDVVIVDDDDQNSDHRSEQSRTRVRTLPPSIDTQQLDLRPATSTLHTTVSAQPETFLSPYVSSIVPSSAYINDPTNEYTRTALPKPYVRLISLTSFGHDRQATPNSPDDPNMRLQREGVALDARKEGNESRWARRGCHPTAVLRPMICKSQEPAESTESAQPAPSPSSTQVKFGIFATKEMRPGDEIVLGWEWDDGHVIHELPAVIESRYEGMGIASSRVHHRRHRLKATMRTFLDRLTESFQRCACGSGSRDCALTQMQAFVDDRESPPPDSPDTISSTRSGFPNDKPRRTKPDLGPLVGRSRGFKTVVPDDEKGTGKVVFVDTNQQLQENSKEQDTEQPVKKKNKGGRPRKHPLPTLQMQQKDVQPEPRPPTREATLPPKSSIRRGGSSRPEDIPHDLVVDDGAPSVSMQRASEPLASIDKPNSVVHNLPSRFVKGPRRKGQTRSVKAVSIATEPPPPPVLPEIAITQKAEISTTPMETEVLVNGNELTATVVSAPESVDNGFDAAEIIHKEDIFIPTATSPTSPAVNPDALVDVRMERDSPVIEEVTPIVEIMAPVMEAKVPEGDIEMDDQPRVEAIEEGEIEEFSIIEPPLDPKAIHAPALKVIDSPPVSQPSIPQPPLPVNKIPSASPLHDLPVEHATNPVQDHVTIATETSAADREGEVADQPKVEEEVLALLMHSPSTSISKISPPSSPIRDALPNPVTEPPLVDETGGTASEEEELSIAQPSPPHTNDRVSPPPIFDRTHLLDSATEQLPTPKTKLSMAEWKKKKRSTLQAPGDNSAECSVSPQLPINGLRSPSPVDTNAPVAIETSDKVPNTAPLVSLEVTKISQNHGSSVRSLSSLYDAPSVNAPDSTFRTFHSTSIGVLPPTPVILPRKSIAEQLDGKVVKPSPIGLPTTLPPRPKVSDTNLTINTGFASAKGKEMFKPAATTIPSNPAQASLQMHSNSASPLASDAGSSGQSEQIGKPQFRGASEWRDRAEQSSAAVSYLTGRDSEAGRRANGTRPTSTSHPVEVEPQSAPRTPSSLPSSHRIANLRSQAEDGRNPFSSSALSPVLPASFARSFEPPVPNPNQHDIKRSELQSPKMIWQTGEDGEIPSRLPHHLDPENTGPPSSPYSHDRVPPNERPRHGPPTGPRAFANISKPSQLPLPENLPPPKPNLGLDRAPPSAPRSMRVLFRPGNTSSPPPPRTLSSRLSEDDRDRHDRRDYDNDPNRRFNRRS